MSKGICQLFFTKGEKTKTVWYYEHKLPEGYKAYSKTKPIQLAEFDSLKKWWTKRKKNEQAWKVDIGPIKKSGYNLDIKNPHQPEPENQYSSGELLGMLHQSFAKSDKLLAQLRNEDELTSPTMHHSFRPSLPDLKVKKS